MILNTENNKKSQNYTFAILNDVLPVILPFFLVRSREKAQYLSRVVEVDDMLLVVDHDCKANSIEKGPTPFKKAEKYQM